MTKTVGSIKVITKLVVIWKKMDVKSSIVQDGLLV